MPLTIEDIARLAGVSKTTVSLIINGKSAQSRISAATDARVRRIVRAKGFAPSRYARGLRARRTLTLGLVLPDLVNPFFARLNEALEREARAHGYQLLVGCSQDDAGLEAEVVEALVSHRIDGLIVASVHGEAALHAARGRPVVPVVYVDREIARGNRSSVASENRAGAEAAVRCLHAQGARRIAFLCGTRQLSTSRRRFEGYRAALRALGLPLERGLVHFGDYAPGGGRRLMERLREASGARPVEAILTAAYTLLEDVLRFLKDERGGIPAGLRLATFDDHPLLDFLPAPVLSVVQDTDGLARAALAQIEKTLAGNASVEQVRVPTRLVER